jgi:uncharacterized protein (TIGR02453 family)
MHVEALIEFLAGLERNNARPWFAWNKPAYDILREEFVALVADVAARVATFDPDIGAVDPAKAMFRIYRDTRFARDKAPYKTQFAAAIGDRSKRGQAPGYYFHVDHAGMLMAGGGIYRPEPQILLAIRKHIAARPALLTRALADKRFAKTYGGLADEDALSRPPKGFAADLPHIDAIRQRHFFAVIETDLRRKPPKDLASDLARHFRDLVPLMRWLRGAVGDAARQ